MRYSLVLAATAVSGSVLPRATFGDPPKVPATNVPHFQVVSLEDAKAKHGNSRVQETAIVANTTAAAATPESEACSANPSVHLEWRNAADADRQGFISAVLCLMGKPPSGNFSPSTSLYEDLVRLHQNFMPEVHNNAKFLPWHRYFLWTFEQELRNQCGLTGPMLWWDETLDAGRFAESDIFTPNTFGTITNGTPSCVADGPFAGLVLHIGPGTDNTEHCLTRGVMEDLTALCSSEYVDVCNQDTDYASYESCIEGGPHAAGHDGIGGYDSNGLGVMSDVYASPSDPVFWLHHGFVDHSWAAWQNLDSSIRTSSIDGKDHEGQPITLDTVLSMGGIGPDVPISTVVDTLGGVSIGGVSFCFKYDY